MKHATKMIITDLDDTLLTSDKTISEYTKNTLKKCQAAGIIIAFATARSTQAAAMFLDMFTPDVFIGYGGALVLAGDDVVHRFDISPEIANQIIRKCLAAPEITGIHAINETLALSNDPGPDITYYQYSDFICDSDNRYLKISLNASSPAVVEEIASHLPMCDMLRYTGEDLYRFADQDAVKWNAVKALADHYGYDTDTLVAFGDDINDLEMVEKCGIGVAVKNAISEVQSVAKYVCDTNDNDGVAKWIEKHLL